MKPVGILKKSQHASADEYFIVEKVLDRRMENGKVKIKTGHTEWLTKNI